MLVMNFKPKNKLSLPFEDTLYKVKSKDGNEVTVESEDSVEYRRNSAHVKRYATEGSAEGTTPEKNAIGNKTSGEENQEQTYSRPRRECRAPKRFDEYLLCK